MRSVDLGLKVFQTVKNVEARQEEAAHSKGLVHSSAASDESGLLNNRSSALH